MYVWFEFPRGKWRTECHNIRYPLPISNTCYIRNKNKQIIQYFFSYSRYVTSYKAQEKMKSGERTVRMSIVDEDSEYMAGHVVDGMLRFLFYFHF